MLILNNAEILALWSREEIMNAIARAYAIYEDSAYYMPNRFHVDYRKKNLLYMPCFTDDILGTKMLTIFTENIERGLPSLDGLMILNDYDTGAPLCLLDGKTITALRTGAVGGLAIQHTAPEDVKTLGIVGAGVQGYYQAAYACAVRQFQRILLYDAYPEILPGFEKRLRPLLPAGAEIVYCDTTTQLLSQAQVIISATTATTPALPSDIALLQGKHFIGIGSYKPHMREFPDALFSLLDDVYIDADIALEESGDLIQPLDAGLLKKEQIRRFGDYLLHEKNKDAVKEKTTFFKSVGIALFDLIAADVIYKKALKQGKGYQM